MAAQLRDEFGNPIQLTDEFGNPVQLTDEHGVPVHVTGIATKERPTLETVIKGDVVEETGLLASTTAGTGGDALKGTEPSIGHGEGKGVTAEGDLTSGVKDEGPGEIQLSSSSSSGSSEDDGEGGRRKKKGLRQKLKEKLNIGKHKAEPEPATVGAGTVQQHVHEQPPHEKKSVIDKIKEKLPGHHSH